MLRKKIDSYFTLEASFLLPLVILGIWFLILLGFYLYNVHCIHQIASIGALRGAGMKRENQSEIKQYVEQEIEKMIARRLVMMEEIEYGVKVGIKEVEVNLEGRMNVFLFSILRDELRIWSMKAEATYSREDPVQVIRSIRWAGT